MFLYQGGCDPMDMKQNESFLKRYWCSIFNELRERWPDLTQSDIGYIRGEKDRLINEVRRRRHISLQEAARDVDEFLDRLDVRQRMVA